MTFSESLTKSLTKGMILFAGIALYLIASVYSPFNNTVHGDAMDVRPDAEGSVTFTLDESGCEPHYGDEFPSGVVWQDRNDYAHYSDDPKVIGKALDSALGGKPWKGRTVNMFCL